MNDVICLSIDAETDGGSALVKKYGVTGFPTLLFLNDDGSPRDGIRGYMPLEPFHAEVKRIKSGEGTIYGLRAELEKRAEDLSLRFELIGKLKLFKDTEGIDVQREAIGSLIAAGKGYVAQDVNSRWELSQKLTAAKMPALAAEQIAEIRRLDPGGQSFPMHRIAFSEVISSIKRASDLDPLMSFLAEETHQEILFDGWRMAYGMHSRASKKTRDLEVAKQARARAREAAVELWKHTGEGNLARIGNQIAWAFYEAADELTDKEKAFALVVAEIAMKASSDDVNVIDTYACCLFINGRVQEAIIQVDRCIELDAENKEWQQRRKEFTATQG